MSERDNEAIGWLLATVVFALHCWSWSFIVPHIWAWHAVPLGLPPITVGTAWGFSMLTLVFRTPYRKSEPDPVKLAGWIATATAVEWVCCLVAYLVRP